MFQIKWGFLKEMFVCLIRCSGTLAVLHIYMEVCAVLPNYFVVGKLTKKEMYSASVLVCHTNFIVSHSVQSIAKLNGCFLLICLLV